MARRAYNKRRAGQCVAELVAGCLVLIPIGLFGLDVLTLAVTANINNSLAKNAARAAANQENSQQAATAARAIVEGLAKSGVITGVSLDEITWGGQQVSIKTTLFVNLPAPLPGSSGITLVARATEPVVGVPVEFVDAT